MGLSHLESIVNQISPKAALLGLLTVVIAAYALSTLFWLVESVLTRGGVVDPEDFEWGLDEIQVRVMTIDNAEVVQATINSLPDEIADVRVVAEREIDIEGATVHVVPEVFTCEARHKGRALEWARRSIPCDTAYVLYLDEDTIVANLTGVPNTDVVQFTELPLYTGSRIGYLYEVFRIGFQYEQRAFHRFKYPLYVWGGGIAIKKSVEDRITWNYPTVTEDTAFVWRAARNASFTYSVVDAEFRNQAPSSVRGMFKQRRRWMSGTRAATSVLPWTYRAFVSTRAVIWGLSPLIVVLAVVSAFVAPEFADMPYLDTVLVTLLVYLHSVSLLGARIYGLGPLGILVSVVLTGPLVVLNTAGALWGLLSPVKNFSVTEKVSPSTIEDVHPGLETGDISRHPGTTSFGDPSAPKSGTAREPTSREEEADRPTPEKDPEPQLRTSGGQSKRGSGGE
jgi:hypothetical protein